MTPDARRRIRHSRVRDAIAAAANAHRPATRSAILATLDARGVTDPATRSRVLEHAAEVAKVAQQSGARAAAAKADELTLALETELRSADQLVDPTPAASARLSRDEADAIAGVAHDGDVVGGRREEYEVVDQDGRKVRIRV